MQVTTSGKTTPITKKLYLYGWFNRKDKAGALCALFSFKVHNDPTYILLGETEVTIEAPADWEEQVEAVALSEIEELKARLEELEAQDVS